MGYDSILKHAYILAFFFLPSLDIIGQTLETETTFTALFNGVDLNGWIGDTSSYKVENGVISVKPNDNSYGNLYTESTFSNFILRFEFQLTPGANNGLGIHAPLEGDAAYLGKELQILDNTAEKYANIKEYQCHGSLYGVMPAERGHLKPVGQWNRQEVIIQDTRIKVTLNDSVILEGDYQEASKNGTLDGKDHPGLTKRSGHIGFLGHGDPLKIQEY